MATDDDKPIFCGFEITNTLEIISDALVGGDNWESLDKRKTASKILTEARYSVEYHNDNMNEETNILKMEK